MNDLFSDDKDRWRQFLQDGEEQVFCGMVWKRKGLFSKHRMLILTDKPRLIYVDPVTMVLKGEIPWAPQHPVRCTPVGTYPACCDAESHLVLQRIAITKLYNSHVSLFGSLSDNRTCFRHPLYLNWTSVPHHRLRRRFADVDWPDKRHGREALRRLSKCYGNYLWSRIGTYSAIEGKSGLGLFGYFESTNLGYKEGHLDRYDGEC